MVFCAVAIQCPNTQRRKCADFNTHEKTTGSLMSQQLCSTLSMIHCLKFDYEFLHQDRNTTKLSVILHTNKSGTQTVWQLVSTEEGLRTAFVPLKTESHFKVLYLCLSAPPPPPPPPPLFIQPLLFLCRLSVLPLFLSLSFLSLSQYPVSVRPPLLFFFPISQKSKRPG